MNEFKLSEEQYNGLVDKLAGEIIEEGLEVTAGLASATGVSDIKAGIQGLKNAAKYKDANKGVYDAMSGVAKKNLAKGAGKAGAIGAGVAAAGAGAAGLAHAIKAKNAEKQAGEYDVNLIIEKAASMYDTATANEQEALEVIANAQAEYNNALEVLAQYEGALEALEVLAAAEEVYSEAMEVLATSYAEQEAVEKVAEELGLVEFEK